MLKVASFSSLSRAHDLNLINAVKLFNVYQLGKVHKQSRNRLVE